MMIEDEELRSLYQTTCKGRLHVLRAGLLGSDAKGDMAALGEARLDSLRREAHSLKGDSRVMGLEDIADIAQQIGRGTKALQQPSTEVALVDSASSLTAPLSQALDAIEQLVTVATEENSGALEAQPIDAQHVIRELDAAIALSGDDLLPPGHEGSSGADMPDADMPDADMPDAAGVASLTSGFIADADIRGLYRTTSDQRFQAMTQALDQLAHNAHNTSALATFRYESQGLKGDSLAAQQAAVAAITQQFEAIANRLTSQSLDLTQPVQDSLWKGMQLLSRLFHVAIAAEPGDAIAPDSVRSFLDELSGHLHRQQNLVETADSPLSTTELIEDEELRDIYKTTSEARLHQLEAGLSQLAVAPDDSDTIASMMREVHGLKGDAQSTQVTPVAELADAFEAVLVRIQNKQTVLTPEVLESFRDLVQEIGALVQTATTGVPNTINVLQLTQNLQALAELATPNQRELDAASPNSSVEAGSHGGSPAEHGVLETASAETTSQPQPWVSRIEDEELREVYRAVSAERLQRLERGLAELSGQPDNSEVMAALLREAHSLKGDARSVGLDGVEQLAHAIEDILIGIQQQANLLTTALGELLLQGVDAIAQLTDEAITGDPSSVTDANALVAELRAVELPVLEVTESTPLSAPVAFESPNLADLSASSAASVASVPPTAETARIETIRVQTRDLDALAAQAEQLTLTRIQAAQTTAKMLELVDLWGKWRTHQRRHQAVQNQATNPYEAPIDGLINRLRLATQENSFRLELISQDLGQQVQTLRLLPVATVLRSFPRVVRDLARQQEKSVELITEGDETTADKRILEDIQDSVMQLVRNAIDHGIETPAQREAAGKPPTAKLWIRSYQSPNSIVIEVADDGRGLDLEQIKQTAIRRKLYGSEELDNFFPSQLQELIFVPGFSTRSFTTEISGRGVGLDVVRTQVERLKGNVQIESTPGQGCTFRLQIRTQLTTANVVFVSVRGVVHALPIEFLQTTMRLSPGDIATVDGKDTIQWNQQTVPIQDLFDVLELANSPAYKPPVESVPDSQKACLLLRSGDELGAFLVDRLLDTQEVVFKPQSAILKRVRNVVGSTILGNGDICTILNPPDLIKSIQRMDESTILPSQEAPTPRKPLILLVEDSPPVRIQEKRLFENAGYEVVTAEDGLEGYNILRAGNFDAVISDIEMPNLDGLALTGRIREHQEYEELPIILVTTLSSEQDRQKGADMGANAYIVKGKFNQEVLLETLHRLI